MSKVQILRDMVTILGADATIKILYHRLGKKLNHYEIGYSLFQLYGQCFICHGKGMLDGGKETERICAYCSGWEIRKLDNFKSLIFRFSLIFEVIEDVMSDLFDNPEKYEPITIKERR